MTTSSTLAGQKKIEVYKKKWAKRSAAAVKAGREVEITTANPWLVGLDAREYTAIGSDWAAAAIHRGIETGVDAATGIPRPPTKGGDPRRMVRDGKFLSRIARSKVSGNASKARAKISGPKGPKRTLKVGSQEDPTLGRYEAALINEAKRGHRYFRLDGLVGRAIQNGLMDYLRADIEGRFVPLSIGRRRASEIVATRSSMLTRGI